MSGRKSRLHQTLTELRRRHVIRVTGAYAVVAWFTLSVSDVVLPALMVPDWVMRLLVVLAVIGLPAVAILTWAFDITPEGVVRTRRLEPDQINEEAALNWSWRWLDYAIILALAAILAFMLLRTPSAEAPGTPDRTIAVLPFADLSPDQDTAYFGDGMAEAIMDALAGVPGLQVTARTSSFAFRNGDANARQVADALGVSTFLEGSVQKSGSRIRITARLIDGNTGHYLWNDTFEGTLDDVFSVQDSISRAIVDVLQIRLLGDRRLVDAATTDREAYDAYLRGRSSLRQEATRETIERAISQFELALERDPGFGLARVALCVAHWQRYEDSMDGRHAERALATCEQARLQIPERAETQVAMGHLHRNTGQLDLAEAAFEQALELDPVNSEAMAGLSHVMQLTGRDQRAEELLKNAIEIDPAYWRHYSSLGRLYYYGRRDYAAAAEQFRKAIRLEPDSARSYSNLGGALQMLGDFEGAAEAFRQSIDREPTARAFTNAGTNDYFLGRYPEAEVNYRAAAQLSRQDYRAESFLGTVISLQPGREDEARPHFERAIGLIRERLAVNEGDHRARAQLAINLLRIGETESALEQLARLDDAAGLDAEVRRLHAEARLMLGERERGLAELRTVLADGWPAWMLRNDPILNELLGAAALEALLSTTVTQT